MGGRPCIGVLPAFKTVYHMHVFQDQKKALDSKFQMLVNHHIVARKANLGFLKDQQLSLTTEQSLQCLLLLLFF